MGLSDAYGRYGDAIRRGFFPKDGSEASGRAIDAVHAEGLTHGRSFRHGNLLYRVSDGANGPEVRMVQWPSYHNAVLNAARTDRRFAELLRPKIGRASCRARVCQYV